MHAALSPWQLMAIGGCAAVVRWAVMSSSPTLPLLLATQGLHAFTFGATHLGAIKFLQAAIPSEISATSYAIYAAVSDGIFMAAASYAAGLLFAVHGQQGAYLAMSGLGFGGACAAALLGRVWNGQALHLGNEKGLC